MLRKFLRNVSLEQQEEKVKSVDVSSTDFAENDKAILVSLESMFENIEQLNSLESKVASNLESVPESLKGNKRIFVSLESNSEALEDLVYSEEGVKRAFSNMSKGIKDNFSSILLKIKGTFKTDKEKILSHRSAFLDGSLDAKILGKVKYADKIDVDALTWHDILVNESNRKSGSLDGDWKKESENFNEALKNISSMIDTFEKELSCYKNLDINDFNSVKNLEKDLSSFKDAYLKGFKLNDFNGLGFSGYVSNDFTCKEKEFINFFTVKLPEKVRYIPDGENSLSRNVNKPVTYTAASIASGAVTLALIKSTPGLLKGRLLFLKNNIFSLSGFLGGWVGSFAIILANIAMVIGVTIMIGRAIKSIQNVSNRNPMVLTPDMAKGMVEYFESSNRDLDKVSIIEGRLNTLIEGKELERVNKIISKASDKRSKKLAKVIDSRIKTILTAITGALDAELKTREFVSRRTLSLAKNI